MLYITGDTHGDIGRFAAREIKALKKGDTLAICGDFGFVWDGSKKEKKGLKKLSKCRYTILFVPGAGENYDLLATYPQVSFAGGQARQIEQNVYQLITGECYQIEGKTLCAFGGGEPLDQDIVDRGVHPDQLPGKPQLDALLRGLEGKKVDLVISYEPPYSIASFLDMDARPDSYYGLYLDKFQQSIQFSQWFFGKHHVDKRLTPRFMGVYQKTVPFKQ